MTWSGSRHVTPPAKVARTTQKGRRCYGARARQKWTSVPGMDDSSALPPIGKPATRALAEAGIHTLDDLRDRDVNELASLHGVGPKAIRLLREALER